MTQNSNPSEILDTLDTERLKNRLLDFPDKILDLKSKVRDARDRWKDAEADRAAEEAAILATIADEKDPSTNKAKFSNAEARNSELNKRKRTNEDYKIAAGVARDAEYALNRLEDELDAVWNRFKANMFVAEIVAAEVNLFAGKTTSAMGSPSEAIKEEPY